jgi:hypothetical protein
MASSAAAFSGAAIYTTWMVMKAGTDVAGLFVITFGAALLISLAVGALIGIPLTWLLAALHFESLLAYLVIGLLTGCIVISQLLSGWSLPTNSNTALEFVTIGGLPGAISGCVWWLMIRGDSVRSKSQ